MVDVADVVDVGGDGDLIDVAGVDDVDGTGMWKQLLM